MAAAEPHNYTDRGRGRPVVLLHGGVANRALWEPTIELLSRYRRAIAIDYGGHGESQRGNAEATLEDYCSEVGEVMELLRLQEPPVLLGHSMGGMIALLYARRHPEVVKGLLLVGVTARFAPLMRTVLYKEIDLIAVHGPRIWQQAGRLLTERNRVALHTHPRTLQAVKRILEAWDFREELPHVQVPVHLASGRFDMISTARHLRYMQQRLPNATMTTLPGGHSCMDSRPAEFQAWLLAKLHELEVSS